MYTSKPFEKSECLLLNSRFENLTSIIHLMATRGNALIQFKHGIMGEKKKKTGSEGVAESMGYGSFTEEHWI